MSGFSLPVTISFLLQKRNGNPKKKLLNFSVSCFLGSLAFEDYI